MFTSKWALESIRKKYQEHTFFACNVTKEKNKVVDPKLKLILIYVNTGHVAWSAARSELIDFAQLSFTHNLNL